MTKSIVVTSGKKYMDIDAYAGCIAYAYLLNNLGYKAKATTGAVLNESIPAIIKKLNPKLDNYIPGKEDFFIVLDVSNPDMIDTLVNQDNVIEIIDHHIGYEDYWNKKSDVKTKIEFIGSVCTMIFELFECCEKTELLNKELCQLLTAGILDNTLNLMASITNARDITAYNKLLKLGNLDSTWAVNYFKNCQEEILRDFETALENDMKIENFSELLPRVFGQLVILEKDKVLEKAEIIKSLFNAYDKEWMLNIISLGDGKSYIIAEDKTTQSKLEKLFKSRFSKEVLTLDKFMLRKEIVKKAKG